MLIEVAAKRVWRFLPGRLRDKLRSASVVIRLRNWVARRRYRGASHDEIFDEDYFRFVDKTTLDSAGIIADSIVSAYNPSSAWDVGCGTGALLDCLRLRNVDGRGLELAEAALRFCQSRNLDVRKFNVLEDSLTDPRRADVVISMEVAAQLPASGADRYVDLLCSLGPVVVFSSEAPGGGDRLSLNEQPHAYWIEKLVERGFSFNERRSLEWREKWKSANVAPWFSRNVLVFEQRADGRPDHEANERKLPR